MHLNVRSGRQEEKRARDTKVKLRVRAQGVSSICCVYYLISFWIVELSNLDEMNPVKFS